MPSIKFAAAKLKFLEGIRAPAPIGANRVRALFRNILNWVIAADIVESNRVHLVPVPGNEHQRDHVLTDEEIRRIWTAIEAVSSIAQTLGI